MSREEELATRFELDGAAGPARRIPPARAEAIVAAALDAALGADVAGTRPTQIEPIRARRGAARGAFLAAASVLLIGGASAGAYYVYQAQRAPEPEKLQPPPARPVVDRAEPIEEPELEPPPPAPIAPEIVVDEPDVMKKAAREDREADDLLKRANALRGERDWKGADELYQQVARRYPRSAAAHVGLVAAGNLHLEHLGDPAGARKLYLRALKARPDGPLAAEARFGLAGCARALGDADGERRLLGEFLEAHADSPLAKRARARLAELK